jgi:serine/threonine protein kinase, bacterial
MTDDDDKADDQPATAAAESDATTIVASPTEAAPELAWSLADDVDPTPVGRQSWGLAWGQAAVFLSIGAVVALVIAVVGWTILRSHHDPQPLPPEAHPASISAVGQVISPSPTPTAPHPALDGSYRLDFDDTLATINGSPSGSKDHHSTWWAFRSTCKPSGCVATGTQLDDNNHFVALTDGGGDRAVFHFRDGRWQEAPDRTIDPCRNGINTTVMAVVSVEPQPDGTLSGRETDTVIGNECHAQGRVIVTPLVLTRIGDVPRDVVVADPAFFD